MDGVWARLSGNEAAQVVDNMTTGVRILSLFSTASPWTLSSSPSRSLLSAGEVALESHAG